MGNTVIQAESTVCPQITNTIVDYKTGNSKTPFDSGSSVISDIPFSSEDVVSITTDSTPTTTEYESANDSETNHLSSCTDISCDIPMDTKPIACACPDVTLSNFIPISDRLDRTPIDLVRHCHPLLEIPSAPLVEDVNPTSLGGISVLPKQIADSLTLNKEIRPFRSRDRSRFKIKQSEDYRRRTSTVKKFSKSNRLVVEPPKRKNAAKKGPQHPPFVHNDFFIFSYDHVFKEGSADGPGTTYSERSNQFDQIGYALSDAINKVSELLDNAEGRNINLTLPRISLIRLLNLWASYVPFFEFSVCNVYCFYGGEQSFSKLSVVEVRRFFAEPSYSSSLTALEFCLIGHSHRLLYVVNMSKRLSVEESDLDEIVTDWSHRQHSQRQGIHPADEINCTAETENVNIPDTVSELVFDTCNAAANVLSVVNENRSNRVENLECYIHAEKSPVDLSFRVTEAEISSISSPGLRNSDVETNICVDSQSLSLVDESILFANDNVDAASLDLIDNKCPSPVEETDEYASCAGSVDGGPVSDGWSDMCSLQSENSFAFPSLRSEILDCAFQLDSINSETMNCNENISEAGPATAADLENINNIPFLNDSSELDFISKIGGTGIVAENLRKQSLYVKFDPLVAGEANNTVCNGETTCKLEDTLDTSKHDPSNDNASVRSNTEERTCSSDVTESPGFENGSVGKLISVTPNRSPRKNKNVPEAINIEQCVKVVTPRSSPRFPETDPDDLSKLQSLLLKQMKKEEAYKEEIESVKRDYEQVLQKLQNAEKEILHLKSEFENTQENEKKLKNELKERIKSKQQLSVVMGEYEKTISQMLTKRDEEKKEYEATIKKVETERDSTVQHLNNLENAFNDIHQKYERGKVVNEALKKNEELLQKSINEYETTVKTVENKYELLKSHATSQLEKANQELELITQSYEKEQAKLKAMLRKSEIQINSLQNALDRKTKENQELTAICDELIVKLSTHSNA